MMAEPAGTELVIDAVLVLAMVAVLSGLFTALAFFAHRPGIFLKRSNGCFHWASWLIYWPYYLYNHAVFGVWRRSSSEPPYHEILPGLFLGRRLGRKEQPLAAKLGAMAVIDLTAEFQEPVWMREQPAYLCLPTLDMTPPTQEAILQCLRFIEEHLGKRPVYVHCALGHGRSAVIVLAYLLVSGKCESLEEALAFVRSQRRRVHLTRAQRDAVRQAAAKS